MRKIQMNERIQELAEQAGYTKDMFGVGHWDMPECKKFAELIVRECEKVIRAEIAVTDIDSEAERAWEMGMECGVGLIKQHFGVEE
jgi:hypothetical protein